MKIEEATIDLLVMTTECDRDTIDSSYRKIKLRTIGRTTGRTLNCCNEPICKVECLNFAGNGSQQVVTTIKISHPSNLEAFNSEKYYAEFSKEIK